MKNCVLRSTDRSSSVVYLQKFAQIILGLFVDDLLITSKDKAVHKALIEELS
jgi:hypothetical protein